MDDSKGGEEERAAAYTTLLYAATAAAALAGLGYWRAQQRQQQQRPSRAMLNRCVIVTGANAGIGRACAEQLASKGARVILACRDASKGQAAAEEIARATGNTSVVALTLDLSSLSSAAAFARHIQQHRPVHVLVNNAGLMSKTLNCVDGLEETFAVNYLGPFYLTNLLLPMLIEDAKADGVNARIVNVASRLEKRAELDLTNLDGSKGHDMWKAYSNSKLCNLLFTYELHRRLHSGSSSTTKSNCVSASVYAVTPGMVHTSLSRWLPPWQGVLTWPLRAALLRSPQQGADTLTFVASDPDVEGRSGCYFADRKEISSSAVSYDQDLANQLWEVSERLIEKKLKREAESQTLSEAHTQDS